MKRLALAVFTSLVIFNVATVLIVPCFAQENAFEYIQSKSAKNPLTVFSFSLGDQNDEMASAYWDLAAGEDSLGHFETAIKYMDSCILSDEQNGDAFVQRARLNFMLNQPYAAIRDIRKAEKLSCSSYYYPISAWIKLFTGDTAGLAQDIRQSVFFYPEDGFTYVLVALYKAEQADSTCINDMRHAIRLDDQPGYRFLEVTMMLLLGNEEDQGDLLLHKCDTLMDRSGSDTALLMSTVILKIMMLVNLKKEDELAPMMDILYELKPNNAEMCLALGEYYKEQQMLDRVLVMARQAETISPDDPYIIYECAGLYYEAQDTVDCLRMLDTLIAYFPSGDAYLFRSGVYGDLGDTVKASDDEEKAMAAFSEEQKVTDAYISDDENLLLFLDSVLVDSPNNPFFRSERGNVLIRLHRFKEAIQDLDVAIQQDPSNAAYYVSRGTAKYSIGDYKGGCADFRKAEKLDPGSARGIIQESCNGY